MAAYHQVRAAMLTGVAAFVLGGCGADGVASPGEGVIILPSNPVSPGNPTGPGPGGIVAAANCPAVVGTTLTNAGLIENRGNGNQWRVCQLPARITSSTVLPKVAGVVYSINGRVDVGSDMGATPTAGEASVELGIEPGVVLFAESGPSWLAVNRGNRINAVGTATRPIIFTGRRNMEGSVDDNSSQLWGGVVLLGRAPITDCLNPGAGVVEGTASCQRDTEGASGALYGGATVADNSGRMKYVQIRYSGFTLMADKELQGLTPSGVGSGTEISHIQVHNSSDDGIEVFGGRLNMKHLVLTGNDDDSLDTDVGYKGNIQFVIAAQRIGGTSGDSIMEIDSDGNEEAMPRQNVKIANFTFIQRNNAAGNGAAIRIRGGADYGFANGVIVAPGISCLRLDSPTTTRGPDQALDEAGPPVFHSVVMQCLGSRIFRGSGGSPAVTDNDVRMIFEAGTNNNNNSSTFVPSLSALYVNGAAETARTAFDLTNWGSFFTPTNYVGAVRDGNDNWFDGWTCNSGTANFGARSGNCTDIPA